MEFVYTPQSLTGSKDAQNQVFGDYTRRDMSDYTQSAYNFLMHQQDNAFNVALMNYMNQYNSPTQQMLRYQAAGLSPFGIASQGSQGAAGLGGSSSPNMRSSGTYSKGVQATMQGVNQLLGVLSEAREAYDYFTYGARQHNQDLALANLRGDLLSAQGRTAGLESSWLSYLMGEEGFDFLKNSPRGQLYKSQSDLQGARVEQMRYFIDFLYPSQKARNDALKALDDYRLQILQGQNDAVLEIHTGNETADMFLKFLSYLLMNRI